MKSEIAPIRSRCESSDIQDRGTNRSTYTHMCKLEAGHIGNHRCICERSWEVKKKA